MKVYYNSDLICALVPHTSLTPFTEVKDDFNLTKTVEEIVGQKQKENPEGELLYIKDIFEEKEVKEVVGFNDTTRKVDSEGQPLEPLMITVQKENEDCDKLYYKIEETEDGQQKMVETTEVTDEPVMIEIQKVTPSGKPVYKLPIVETKTIREKIREEEVTEVTDKPAMEDVRKEREVSILKEPELFNINEVIEAKVKSLKEELGENIFYDEIINLDNIEGFQGNTGLGAIVLAPNSKFNFKTITLSGSCNLIRVIDFKGDDRLKLYAGKSLITNEETKLGTPIKQVTYSVINPTDEYLELNTVAILASQRELTDIEKLQAQVSDMQLAINDLILGGMKL